MSTAPAERLHTREEYLDFERLAETRHEFFRGRIYAMSGANEPHVLCCGNVSRELGNGLRGDGGDFCRVYGPDMRVECGDGRHCYPDVSVCCGEPDLFKFKGTDTLRNPEAIVEVLSKSTDAHDRGAKFDSYRTIPSLREYLLVSTVYRRVERFVRSATGGWRLDVFHPHGGDDAFPVLSAAVPFDGAYRLTHLGDDPPPALRVVIPEEEPQYYDPFDPDDVPGRA